MESDNNLRPSTTFNAQNAVGYEQAMGRWSQRLAPMLVRFGGLEDGERILDVGCGTGSLTYCISEAANVGSVVGVDQAGVYVEYARSKNPSPRLSFQKADAVALPFPDRSFDRAYSLLVLMFIPDAARAVAEMARVVRPGGTVAAATWDSFGGMPAIRLFWDIAATLDPSVKRRPAPPMTTAGEMETAWRALGLVDVEQTSLLIRMDYSSFDDYWLPLTSEGVVKQFIESLPTATRQRLPAYMRDAYLSGMPDGPRSFVAVAWACKGTVPSIVSRKQAQPYRKEGKRDQWHGCPPVINEPAGL